MARKPRAALPPPWRFRLYIDGSSARSARALANLWQLCDERLHGRFEIDVVDVAADPAAAMRDQIVALPSVVRQFPLPLRTAIGDLTRTDRVCAALDL